MDRESAIRFLSDVFEYLRISEERPIVVAEKEKWEAILAKSEIEVAEAEKELLEAEKGLLEAEKEFLKIEEKVRESAKLQESFLEKCAQLRKEMAEIGSVLVDDASQIDAVESLIKDHKLVCDFYTADPEIMEEMKRRGLPCHPPPL